MLLLSACAGTGPFIWYRDLPKTEWEGGPGDYVINVGDTVTVQVYGQEALTGHAKIRQDGRIALPLIGEIVAAGKKPLGLAQEVETRLAQYIQAPHATVNVDEAKAITVSTLGEVAHVGALTLEPQSGLLQALALAGGTSEYADKSRIFVLRRAPTFRRIRFTYEDLVENRDGAASFPLRTGDVIVVE